MNRIVCRTIFKLGNVNIKIEKYLGDDALIIVNSDEITDELSHAEDDVVRYLGFKINYLKKIKVRRNAEVNFLNIKENR